MKNLFKVLLAVLVIIMAYVTFKAVWNPVQFDKIQKKRELAIQQRLKKIAGFQAAFESVYNRFATGPELQAFLANGKLYYVNAEGEYTDDMREKGISEREAAAKGFIKRDTVWVDARDSLVHGDLTIVENLLKVPGVESQSIQIDTASIQQIVGVDTIYVPVYQAVVPYEAYLSDLNEPKRLQEKIDQQLKKNKGYPGLKIGSLTEVKNTGNWE